MKWIREQKDTRSIPEETIHRFVDELEKYRINMHGFSLSRGNRIIAEGFWKPFHGEKQHRMYSVGKTLTALGIGLLEADGKLALDDRVCVFFPEFLPEILPPKIEAMTLKHLLTMRTAHSQTTYKRSKGDWVESFFTIPPDKFPGGIFSYDTSASHVLSALIEKLSGKSMMDFLRSRFLDRIGFSEEARFLTDPRGVSQGGSGLICTQDDLRNLGYLLLQKGSLEGEQLLPSGFIGQMLEKQAATDLQPHFDEQWGYGYQIWKTRRDGFALYGLGGQLAIGLPREDLLFVTTADTQGNPWGTSTIHRCFWDILHPALKEKPSASQAGTSETWERRKTTLQVYIPEIDDSGRKNIETLQGDYLCSAFKDQGIEGFRLKKKGGIITLQPLSQKKLSPLFFGIDCLISGEILWDGFPAKGQYYAYAESLGQGQICLTLKRTGDLFAELRLILAVSGSEFTAQWNLFGESSLKKYEGVYCGSMETCKE